MRSSQLIPLIFSVFLWRCWQFPGLKITIFHLVSVANFNSVNHLISDNLKIFWKITDAAKSGKNDPVQWKSSRRCAVSFQVAVFSQYISRILSDGMAESGSGREKLKNKWGLKIFFWIYKKTEMFALQWSSVTEDVLKRTTFMSSSI